MDAGEHLLKVLLQPRNVFAVADDFQQILVADEVKPGERRSGEKTEIISLSVHLGSALTCVLKRE